MLQLRDKKIAEKIIKKIKEFNTPLKIMHVCGTHQDTIVKYGIDGILKECNIEVIQGPGCPVCVTTPSEIHKAILLAENGHTIATFGDMVMVPAGGTSLQRIKAEGGDVRIVYSIDDAIKMAEKEEMIFIGVGFETTAPSTAATILRHPQNFRVLSCHRYVPPAMDALLGMGEIKIDGIICPGHVSAIIGTEPYMPISRKYRIPQVVAGFEPLDVLMAVYMIARQIEEGRHEVENEYGRVVKEEGNEKAKEVMKKVFEPEDAKWRGFPSIPLSKMKIRKDFEEYDAEKVYEDIIRDVEDIPEPPGCRCGDVLRGVIYPQECPLFGRACTPSHPVGPCMVSMEGACNIEYKYKND